MTRREKKEKKCCFKYCNHKREYEMNMFMWNFVVNDEVVQQVKMCEKHWLKFREMSFSDKLKYISEKGRK